MTGRGGEGDVNLYVCMCRAPDYSPDLKLHLWQVAFHIQPYKGRDDITVHDNIKYIIDT